MSDSEHSTVTYTSVPEDDSDIGSPGVEGPIFQDPPSPDYVPGPEGPPIPVYVPGGGKPRAGTTFDLYNYHLFGPANPLAVADPGDAGIRQRDARLRVHETEMPGDVFYACVEACHSTPGPGYETAAPWKPEMSRELGYGIRDTWDDLVGAIQEMLDSDRPFHRRTALLIEEEARLSRAAWARSMDACDQVHSEGISLRTTVMAQQSEITELQAADRRRQAVITDLLKADYRRQRQLVETLKIVKSLKAQMIELQRQQGPAKDPAEPELPEEASSST
ncbi:hypothetical protein Tco_0600013 [Tanacetum coccineum]|uniref:Uncharacterized protein n=1 Tax=Tanacetum coccineum TaxID=301880 RepID=A0ABQ4WAK6_9ASTR